MNKITVRQSCIIISDYNIGDCRRLERQFEIYDPICHRSDRMGMYYDQEHRKLYVSRCVDIAMLEAYFGCTAYIDRNKGTIKKIDNVKLLCTPRDDEQKEALRFMIGSGEYERTKNCSQLGLYLNTGKGKTYSAIATSTHYKMKSIIITSSSSWLNQWKGEIMNFTNMTNKDICFIDSSKTIQRLLSLGSDKYSYFLITHSLIQSYCTENGWDALGKLFDSLGIGIKFIDEAHLCFNNICMIDFYTNVWRTYYITATPTKSSDDEKVIYARYFKNLLCVNLFNKDKDPHTDYVAIIFNSEPYPWEKSDMVNAYGLDRNKYTNWVVDNERFRQFLHIIMEIALKKEGKCLFYIGTNEAILKVKDWIEYNYPELIGNVGIFTSIISDDEKEKAKEKKIILSTTKSFGAAVDCKGLVLTVNLAEPFKSEVLARQTLGRTRDDNTMYIDVVDKGFAQTRKFYYSKLPIFRKYALSVKEITLDKYTIDARVKSILESRRAPIAQLIVDYSYQWYDRTILQPIPIAVMSNNTNSLYDYRGCNTAEPTPIAVLY